MAETLFEELKRYVGFSSADEAALRALHPLAKPFFVPITEQFYARILEHEGARAALIGGESSVGHLKVTLRAWLDKLLSGPWDEAYFDLRCRIGRVHVRIELPQHYMFGAMNVIRQRLGDVIDEEHADDLPTRRAARVAVGRALDLELAIMLHTYREDYEAQQARRERLATFGQLVGTMSHELRNPLGVIETSVHILKGRTLGDERAEKHVTRIGEQVAIANKIVTDLLDMIRDRPLTREPIELHEVIGVALADVRDPTGVRIVVEGLEALPPVAGDRGQLRQLFFNLVQNAVQACGERGQVRVRGVKEGGVVAVMVEDNGPGVDAAILRRLFEPLVTTKQNGVGLGLALVKRIAERHHGSVGYEPRNEGGARFVVRLPTGSA